MVIGVVAGLTLFQGYPATSKSRARIVRALRAQLPAIDIASVRRGVAGFQPAKTRAWGPNGCRTQRCRRKTRTEPHASAMAGKPAMMAGQSALHLTTQPSSTPPCPASTGAARSAQVSSTSRCSTGLPAPTFDTRPLYRAPITCGSPGCSTTQMMTARGNAPGTFSHASSTKKVSGEVAGAVAAVPPMKKPGTGLIGAISMLPASKADRQTNLHFRRLRKVATRRCGCVARRSPSRMQGVPPG